MGQRLIGRLAAYGCTLALAGSTRAQAADAVSIELFSDGRCAVSAKGEGFRSTATYKPQVTPDPHELRCAMPPVPAGRTIALTVTLPPGTRQPAGSLPSLAWSQAADRWTGTAELADWPDTVTISTSSRLQTLWAPGAGNFPVSAQAVIEGLCDGIAGRSGRFVERWRPLVPLWRMLFDVVRHRPRSGRQAHAA